MTDENSTEAEQEDTRADAKAILIIFAAAVLLAVHLISGFSFDY